jgi:hypothetical protein
MPRVVGACADDELGAGFAADLGARVDYESSLVMLEKSTLTGSAERNQP